MDLLIRLIIWVIKEIISGSTQPPVSTLRVDTQEERLARSVAQIAGRLLPIKVEATQQLSALDEYEEDLRAQVAPVLEEGVLARVNQFEGQPSELIEAIKIEGASSALPLVQDLANRIQILGMVVEVTKELLRQRRSAADQAVLGDADALAIACYQPILDFARRHQLPIRSNRPMTLFYPSGTFIELGFIEHGLAPIGLPAEYRSEPWRWPAIAHEIAHDLYASLPNLEREMIQRLHLESDPEASSSPGDESFDRLLLRIWLEEIFADVVGALMLGPAYLASMRAVFRQPGTPENVVTTPVSPDSLIDVHPPRHVRVHITARVLERQGFGKSARELVRAWDQEHGNPQEAVLVTPRGRDTWPLGPLLERAGAIADRLYDLELSALAGHRLADVPGLDFSKLHARSAEHAAPRLAEGQLVAFDARVLIAAATSAALANRDRIMLINEATRRSIVGVGTGERVARVRALSSAFQLRGGRGSARWIRTRRVVEALLLQEILERRGDRYISRRTRS